MRGKARGIRTIIAAGCFGLVGSLVPGADEVSKPLPTSFHEDFESAQTAWQSEHTDTTIKLLAHDRSARAIHDGKQSEHFQFDADVGSQFFVSYPLPRIPVTDDLQASVYVRANRVGVQLYGRIVLPADIDPETRAPSFVLIAGTVYDRVDRWQRLELASMLPSIERQARVLRASSRRPVSLKGAYLERLVVNLMGSPGASEVFLDDLSVSPVPASVLSAATKPGAEKEAAEKARGFADPPESRAKNALIVRLDQNYLRRLGGDGKYHDWLPTAIDAPGADVVELRKHGFDLLVDDRTSRPERIKTALSRGFLLLPQLSGISSKSETSALLKEVADYPYKDAVAFWQIGEGLGRKRELAPRSEELRQTRELVSAMRQLPPRFSRLTTGLVDGDLPLYARVPANLDTIGIKALLWASAQDPVESFEFLAQRRRLTARSNTSGLFWAWIPATAPAIVRANIWGDDTPPAWGLPQVTPEQLRLMTYMALSAGYRGLGYLGDADLTDPTKPAARALLIEMAFLNEEIDLCESMLARSADPIPEYKVFDPDPSGIPPPGMPVGMRVRPQKEFQPKPGLSAAAIKVAGKGTLLLLADYAANAQFAPPQMAARNLVIRPSLPEDAAAFQITPGDVKILPRERVPRGTQLTIDEFDSTALILCTTDLSIKDRIEAAIARVRPLAVQMAIEQAEILLQSVTEISDRLSADGQTLIGPEDLKRRTEAGIVSKPTDERDLLASAEASIKAARELQEREDFAQAWEEARRARRPLRTLANGHWTKAYFACVKAASEAKPQPNSTSKDPIPILIKPVCCPPCVSFNTLPELYFWIDWIASKTGFKFGANRVPSGTFDDPKAMAKAGWVNIDYQVDGIKTKMETVLHDGSKSDRAIHVTVEPTVKEDLDKNQPFFDFPIAAIRSPSIPVEAKNLIRISFLVKRPIASLPGMGGIIARDSIGGEQFQYRTADPIPTYSRVILYRKAPADGSFSVTLGLAGYGEAYFDDFRVELVEADAAQDHSNLATTPPRHGSAQPTLPDPSLPAAATNPGGSRVR